MSDFVNVSVFPSESPQFISPSVWSSLRSYFNIKVLCPLPLTKKVIRKTESPILNNTLPLFISKLAGLALKSQPVKSKILRMELRYRFEILYDVS